MTITLPSNVRGPVLDLTLPASADALDIILRNVTTGKRLVVNLPAAWGGDDLSLDFRLRTIVDQTGADRSALLDPDDHELWTPEPLIAGVNDVEIEALTPLLSSTRSPGKAENSATSGTAWTNATNAKASDNAYATVAFTEPNLSQFLVASEYGFAATIPEGATILGLQPGIERSQTGAGAEVVDQSIRLLKAGVATGDEKSKGAKWTGADEAVLFGGAADLWGTTWTRAELVAANFSLRLRCATTNAGTARVDHMPMTAYYRVAAAAYGATATLRWEKGYF